MSLIFYFVKSRIYFVFTCIFHTCIYVFVEVFQECTGLFSRVAVYTGN